MLNFYARFVPGFSPSFGVFPAFIRLAESEGFEPPIIDIRNGMGVDFYQTPRNLQAFKKLSLVL